MGPIMERFRARKEDAYNKENEQYKNDVINARLNALFASNPELKANYDTRINTTTHEINNDLIQDQLDTQLKFSELRLRQQERQGERFTGLNSAIDTTGGILLNPFRSVAGAFESVEEGGAKIVGGLTSTLTSPVTLIILAGGVFIYFKS